MQGAAREPSGSEALDCCWTVDHGDCGEKSASADCRGSRSIKRTEQSSCQIGSWAKTSRSSQRPCRGAESPPHSRRGRTHGVAFRPCHGRRLSSSSINNGAPPLAVGTPMSERSLSQAPRSSSRYGCESGRDARSSSSTPASPPCCGFRRLRRWRRPAADQQEKLP